MYKHTMGGNHPKSDGFWLLIIVGVVIMGLTAIKVLSLGV